MTLASATAVESVCHEAALLEIHHFFEGRTFGPDADPRGYTKLAVMQHILSETGFQGAQLIGIGDGEAEIQYIKQLGGIAIGCASDETHRSGHVEGWKRTRLIQAGADIIIPDYQDWATIAPTLFNSVSAPSDSSVP